MEGTEQPAHPVPELELREVAGHPGYYIARNATVWSLRRPFGRGRPIWRELKQTVSSHGYRVVGMRRKENQRSCGPARTKYVHVLMLEGFLCPRPSENSVGCHRNDDRTDNRLENLYWGSQSDNVRDAIRNGKIKVGRQHPAAKMSEKDACVAAYLLDRGVQAELVAATFGVCVGTLQHVVAESGKHADAVAALIGDGQL